MHVEEQTSLFLLFFAMSALIPGSFSRSMNQHQTTTEGNFYLQMMATCISSQEMVEWQETRLENMGMPRTSKMSLKN